MTNLAHQKNKSYIPIDPRTKLLLFFTVSFTIFGNVPIYVEVGIFIFIAIMLINAKLASTAIKMLAIFSVLLALDIFITPLLDGILAMAFLTITHLFRLFLPLFFCSILVIKTTTVSEFIAAFKKMHLSEKIIIPFSVMFRFFPTVKEEWSSIRNSMRLRGIAISFGSVASHPMMTLEYVMIPLLMSVSTISSDLAAASLSRGLDTTEKRTCLTTVKLRVADYIIFTICIAFIIYALVIL